MPLVPRLRDLRNRRQRTIAAGATVATALAVVAVLAAGAEAPNRSPSSSTMASPTITTPAAPSAEPPPSTPARPVMWPLAAVLDRVWADTPGGCVRVTARHRLVFEADPDAAVVPASVTKLFAAAAALRVPRAEHSLRTTVRAVLPPVNGR